MDFNRIIAYIKSNKKTYITDLELRKLYENHFSYDEVAGFVNELVESGKLKHAKREKTNGMNPPMYVKYKLVKQKEDYSDVKKEIMLLNSNLNPSYYLEKPKEYLKHREYILKLNQYFWEHEEKLKKPMSVNERAYDIWGVEKFIKAGRKSSVGNGSGKADDKLIENKSTKAKSNEAKGEQGLGRTIMKNLGVTEEKLNIYDTPEPFFYYINDRESSNVLIIENKDTWYTIRRLLKEGQNEVLGFHIGILIYGQGRKIKSSIEFLSDEELSFLHKPIIKYWGDIDYTGIDIFYSLKEKVDIELFMPAYEFMIDRAADIDELEDMKDQKERKHALEFIECFDAKRAGFIRKMLSENKYIPQEIINYQTISAPGVVE